MSKKENDFAKYLSYFFSKYLPGQQNASTHTIVSYRDTFKLFLRFWEDEKGLSAETIKLNRITRQSVTQFLDWIEEKRKCSVATRNQRLSALHAFFRYVQCESPENLFEMQKILAIPVKRKPKPLIPYLTADEMKILPGSELETLSHKYGMQYSTDAPHFVVQTTSFSKEEIVFASKLTAILFRIINSPLKNNFFSLKEKTGKTTLEILKDIFYYIYNNKELKDTYLVKNDNISDIYWNEQIFREIPSQQILTFLENYHTTKRHLHVS